jgi:hypothetical protein
MACRRTSPIVTFEQDAPVFSFLVTEGGQPMRLNNFIPQLHVLSQGKIVAEFELVSLNIGELTLRLGEGQTPGDFLAQVAVLTPESGYKAQIFLKAVIPPSNEIGLNDIIEPYWSDYIPPEDHVPGYFSGEIRQDQTIPTEIPWAVREAFKLRGTQNG